MKRFLINILIFAAIFTIVEKASCFFISNATNKEYDKRLEYILEGKMNKNIIILGSSRGANNVSAKQIEDATKKSTYNLSYRGADIIFQEFILKTLIKFNKPPEKIILVIDNIYQFKNNSTLDFRIDRLQPLKKYKYVNDELISRGEKSILSNFFCLARVNRKDFSLKKVNVLPVNVMDSHGSKLLESRLSKELQFINEVENYKKDSENQNKINAFKNIEAICKANNIELFYVFTPSYSTFNTTFLNRFKRLTEKPKNIMVYDSADARYKDKSYFRDHTHLFKTGTFIFTDEICDFINSQ